MSKVTAPMLSVQGQTIVIQVTNGPTVTPVAATIFLVLNLADVTPAKDSKNGVTDASGNLTLTSIALPAGKYHVQTTFSIAGRNPQIFDGTIVIPMPAPVVGGGN